ncbi:MAG: tetratricopeptide repeat protein, partial [Aggregatilineales bacterium]
EDATVFIEAGYEIYKSYNNKRGMAYALNDLAGVIFVTGDYRESEAIFAEAYGLHKEMGDRNGIAHSISALGNNATVNGDYEKARQCYRESLKIRRDLGDKRGIADSLQDLARSELNTGNIDVAKRHIDDAIKMREEIGDRVGAAEALAGRAIGLVSLGAVDDVLPDIERVLELGKELDSGFLHIQGQAAYGEYLYQKGNYEESLGYFLEVLDKGNNSNVPVITMLALSGIAGILIKFGQVERALSLATVVQRFPQGFLPLAQIRAEEVVKDAEKLLSKEQLSTISSESQMLVPQKLINGILTEFAGT